MTYTAQLDAMFIESRPLDDIGFQSIVDLRHELEGQGLCRYNQFHALLSPWRQTHTLRTVVGGMQ